MAKLPRIVDFQKIPKMWRNVHTKGIVSAADILFTPSMQRVLAVGGGVGLITGGGYEERFKPAAGLVVRYQLERLSATVRVFPKPPPSNNPRIHRSALTALEFSWRL